MDAQIKEALTGAREVLRGLSFKDVAITSALEAIARTLDTERAPNGQAPAQPAPAAQDDAKPHWSVNRYCRAGMCLKTDDRHEHDCPHGCNTIDAARAADKKEPT